MNRWLIVATIVFSCGLMSASAAPTVSDLPAKGEIVTVDADPMKSPLSIFMMNSRARIGDPDSANFDNECNLSVPLTIKVLGAFADTIVVEYRTTGQNMSGQPCSDSSILLMSSQSWKALKSVEAALAKEKAEKQARRDAVRAIMRQNGVSAAKAQTNPAPAPVKKR